MAPELLVMKDKPNISHWTMEIGYDNVKGGYDYPIRVFNARQDAALVIALNIFGDDIE